MVCVAICPVFGAVLSCLFEKRHPVPLMRGCKDENIGEKRVPPNQKDPANLAGDHVTAVRILLF